VIEEKNDQSARDRRLMRWALQAGARELLPQERVAWCFRKVVPGFKTVDLMYSEGVKRAHYANLRRCASLWVCPICGAKISERRKVELAFGVDHNPDLMPVLMTFTLRHNPGDSLAGALLPALLNSYRFMKGGRKWQDFVERYGLVGSVRSLEVTHGAAGWHPHLHTLGFFQDRFDVGAVTGFFKERWCSVLERHGRDATWAYGVDVRSAASDVALYLQKFGHGPIDTRRPFRWSMECEVAKSQVKVARTDGRRSPMQMLADYTLDGDVRAGELWQEYARAFKGKRQLVWSRGLRKRLGLVIEETDEEIAKRDDEPACILARLALDQWRVVLANDARGELREIGDSGDFDKVQAFLADIGAGPVMPGPALQTTEVESVESY
jgi:hypothetical protein